MKACVSYLLIFAQILLPLRFTFADDLPQNSKTRDYESRLELRLAIHSERDALVKLASDVFTKFDLVNRFGGSFLRPSDMPENELNYVENGGGQSEIITQLNSYRQKWSDERFLYPEDPNVKEKPSIEMWNQDLQFALSLLKYVDIQIRFLALGNIREMVRGDVRKAVYQLSEVRPSIEGVRKGVLYAIHRELGAEKKEIKEKKEDGQLANEEDLFDQHGILLTEFINDLREFYKELGANDKNLDGVDDYDQLYLKPSKEADQSFEIWRPYLTTSFNAFTSNEEFTINQEIKVPSFRDWSVLFRAALTLCDSADYTYRRIGYLGVEFLANDQRVYVILPSLKNILRLEENSFQTGMKRLFEDDNSFNDEHVAEAVTLIQSGLYALRLGMLREKIIFGFSAGVLPSGVSFEDFALEKGDKVLIQTNPYLVNYRAAYAAYQKIWFGDRNINGEAFDPEDVDEELREIAVEQKRHLIDHQKELLEGLSSPKDLIDDD
ncbi:MAG TPA: hypothetical protein VJL87_02360, partial [Bdellovibrionota bacterium]|nr:hypothetical protein [Bdellovibrionota bacterium]